MQYMDDYEYMRFYNRLWNTAFSDEQLRELYELFRGRLGLDKKRHHHGKHLTDEQSQKLDSMILDGRSQKECCSICHVSPTTYKRHKAKLRNEYRLVPDTPHKKVDTKAIEDYNSKKAESFMRYKDKCADKRYNYTNEDGIIFID